MSSASPDIAQHLAGEVEILRVAIADAALAEVAAVGILWVDSDAPVVLRAYAVGSERLDELAGMYPHGPADLWLPEDWEGTLPLPSVTSGRRRAAAAAKRALRVRETPAEAILATVLGALAKTLNEDPTVLAVPTARHFFAFASHHDVNEELFDALERDASPVAVGWLRDRDLLRFADPYP